MTQQSQTASAPNSFKGLHGAAIPALFFLLGVVYASWASRLPGIRDALQLDPATLGTVLLGSGIGAVCSFPIAAWLVGHYGARQAAAISGAALLLVLPILAWMPSWPLLMFGLFCLGAGTSSFDVAINALGAEMEREAQRSLMSMLHAWFCVGTFSGALLGSGAAAIDLPPWLHFLLISGGLIAMLAGAWRVLPCDAPDPELGRKHFALPHGALVWLGMIAFLGAIAEGSLTNWISLYMNDHLHAGAAVAPLAYAAFAGAMLVARWLGDGLKERHGAGRLVAASSVLACIGISIAIAAPSIWVAIIGFTLTGLGVAAVFPVIFSAAGKEGAAALAGVATLGYSGALMGPPVMGYMVHGFGLQAGLGLLAVICLGVAVAAFYSRLLRA